MAFPPSATDRYKTDALFRTLVDTMYCYIDHATFTPTEIREAAMLAHILYEERQIRPMLIDTGREIIMRDVR